MSASYLRSLSVKELRELLAEDGASNVSKCNKEELIRRLLLRAEHPNLNSTLYRVDVISPEAHHDYPSGTFQELKSFTKSKFRRFTEENFGAWFEKRKALASKTGGRKLAIKKFIKCIDLKEGCDGVTFVRAVCAAETTKNKDYGVKLVLGKETALVQATCCCAAGSGWSAACKHIAALCFNLEHYGLCGESMELVSKTSKPQEWGKPGRQVGCLTADTIAGVAPSVCRPIKTSQEDLLSRLLVSMVPSSPLFCPPDWQLANQSGSTDSLESRTKGQSSSVEWVEARRELLTGSMMYSVLRTVESGNFAEGPALRQINPPDLSKVNSIKWGRKNEKTAIRVYEKIMGVKVLPCGIFKSSELDFVGATPDGLSDDGKTVIEIKCPYSIRNGKPSDCLYVPHTGLLTKKEYYTQVQTQLIVTGRDICDFVVWTPRGIIVQSVPLSTQFKRRLLNAAELYYHMVFMPLLQKHGVQQ